MTEPTDLDARSLIERIDRGDAPRDFVVLAAKGFLPLAQSDLIEVLAHLASKSVEDQEIAILAKGSIEDIPPKAMVSFAKQCKASETLALLAGIVRDREALETILRNRSTSDETIESLAGRAKGPLQEAIVINQERLLRTPTIIDALLANPSVLPDVRRRALETREEFFEKKKRLEEQRAILDDMGEDVELSTEQQATLDALIEQAEEEADSDEPSLPPPERSETNEKEDSIWTVILKMTVAEKVQLAFKGGRMERAILIRDRNKMVCRAVIRNPRLSDSEIESFAGMRSIESEVLREIGANREWMRKYSIMLALARNPKTPIATSLPLVPRLNHRDLRLLSLDRNVAEAIRSTSRRLFLAKTQGFKARS